MESNNTETKFVICISNKDYPASLEVRKIYQVIPDANGDKYQMIRVVDESDEDYLYPSSYFIPIELPKAAIEALAIAS
jgi:hypothetical protein